MGVGDVAGVSLTEADADFPGSLIVERVDFSASTLGIDTARVARRVGQ